MKTLILTESEIKPLLQIEDAIKVVEQAFRAKSDGMVQMPPKPYLYFKKYDGDLRIMPAYLEDVDTAGVKIVNSHPLNPDQGLPTVMAVIVLSDPKTGMPLGIFSGTRITALRTAAASAIAAKYLSRKNSRIAAIIGTGAQAESQLTGLCMVRKIEEARVFDIIPGKSEEFAKKMKGELGIIVKPANSIKESVEGCDILTTITPVRKPIIKNEFVGEGMHINAVGADAPGKQELEPEILTRANIVVDDWDQASHGGEINIPLSKGIISKASVLAEIGEIVSGTKEGRTGDNEITLFDSTGLAIQDVSTAYLVYNEAKRKGAGMGISLI